MNKADRILHTRISVSIGTDKQSLSLPIEIVFNEFYKQDPDQFFLTRDKDVSRRFIPCHILIGFLDLV